MTQIKISNLDYPRCFICDLPVEDFYVEFLDDDIVYEFVALCHQDEQRVGLTRDEMEAILDVGLGELGPAFYTEQEKTMGVTYLAGESGPTDTVTEESVIIEAADPTNNDPEAEEVEPIEDSQDPPINDGSNEESVPFD